MKKFFKKENRGITLVALVITIIILLILAGISISALTNQGLFGRANEAKRDSEIASIKEKIALDIYEKQLEPPLGSITDEQLETILRKYGTVNKEDGTIVGITTAKGYEILLKDIYGGETVAETVPDGAIVNPVNDITTWLKTGEISKQYSYTTIEQVIADSTCTESLMNNENAMKYLARSTEFANAICASETTMTSLGKSAYVDDTVLNSDIWLYNIENSQYYNIIYNNILPTMTSNTNPSGTARQRDSISSNRYDNVAFRAFDKDENTLAASDSGISWWIVEYAFDSNTNINGFSVYDNLSHHGTYYITKYQFIGSNDGINYDVIETYEEAINEKHIHLFKCQLNYKWYGIKALSTNVSSDMNSSAYLSEIELLSR